MIDSIRKLLGPRTDGYTVNEVKDTIGMFKFKKHLVNSIVRNLNEVPDYKPITEFQRSSLLKYYEDFRINSDKVLGKQLKYDSNVLFHLLRLVGCTPDPGDFPLNERVSNQKQKQKLRQFLRLWAGIINQCEITPMAKFHEAISQTTFLASRVNPHVLPLKAYDKQISSLA